MKIRSIHIWHVPLTSHETYYMAEGKTCDKVESVVIRVNTDEGIAGWGEVCPIPHYLPAYARGVAPVLSELAPVLIGADPLGVEALMERVDRYLIGHDYAKSALDIALWDITAKKAGLPLYAFLGGRQNATMPLYHSVTCVEPDDMVRIAKTAHQAGMRQIQVKLGADGNWRNDVARLVKVREAMPEDVLVYGDWNAGASKLDAIRVGRAVMHLDIMLEQPCESIAQCADVKNATGLAMKLDENAHDWASLLEGARQGCMDAVAIKTSKFGGLSKARKARDLCVHLGARMCIEDTWGSDVAMAAALHLGASTPAKFIMNLCDLSHYVAPRLDANAPVRHEGWIAPPEGEGLGVNPELSNPDATID